MFSKNPIPSTSGQPRNQVLGIVDESMQSTNNQGLQNRWLTMNHPSQHLEYSMINPMEINPMNQNNNGDVLANPFANTKIISKFNVKDFDYSDLKVSIENGFIVIRGSHYERREGYGLVSRKFTRRVPIPRDVLEEDIKVQLVADGILTITAKEMPKVREIPIQHMNQPSCETQRNLKKQWLMEIEREAATNSNEHENRKSLVPIVVEEKNLEENNKKRGGN